MNIFNLFRRKLETEHAAYETIKEETIIIKQPDAPKKEGVDNENHS